MVDTRPPEQYRGEAVWTPTGSRFLEPDKEWTIIEGERMRAGHIPGAVHLESSGNLDPDRDWIYLSREDIRRRAAEVGITQDNHVITYCGVGISASLGLFALYLAGYRKLSLYDASWFEWGTNPENPIEKPG